MERQKKVIDASICVKLFADEENSDKAFKLIERYNNEEIVLIAPSLIFLETLNALKYKKFDKFALEKSNRDMFDFQFEIIDVDKDILEISIRLSNQHNLSIYDSFYAAISEKYNAELVTADDKLSKIPNAKLLSSLQI